LALALTPSDDPDADAGRFAGVSTALLVHQL
jgi:hypothetical protein